MPAKKRTKRKTAKKTVKLQKPSGRNGNQLPAGAHPGNTGGKKGRSGRKPNEFKAFCNDLLRDPDVQAKIESKAKDGDLKAVELAAKYTQELPKQGFDVFHHEEALDELE